MNKETMEQLNKLKNILRELVLNTDNLDLMVENMERVLNNDQIDDYTKKRCIESIAAQRARMRDDHRWDYLKQTEQTATQALLDSLG